jgi:hypothetical protein
MKVMVAKAFDMMSLVSNIVANLSNTSFDILALVSKCIWLFLKGVIRLVLAI